MDGDNNDNNNNNNNNNNNSNNKKKHLKYIHQYRSNDEYWGLGIENELYLELSRHIILSKTFVLNNHRKERYSTDYYSNYKPDIIPTIFSNYLNEHKINDDLCIRIPLLINSHSFTKTDMSNNPKTLYNKTSDPNPKFTGKTLYEILTDYDSYFKNNDCYVFDGDTIEIMTQNYYKATLPNIIHELKFLKNEFIEHIQNCQQEFKFFEKYGKINWMRINHPMACFLTNRGNLSIFCNGTIHYNITLPTKLDKHCKIKNMNKFIEKHKILIRLIQIFEPFFIAVFGTPDPFVIDHETDICLSKSSQRCAVSKYIGIGTYDTDKMLTGKQLYKNVNEFPSYFWYHKYYDECSYTKKEKIGYDINFNKYDNHGVEIRFFEHMEYSQIYKSFLFICLLADLSLEFYENDISVENPVINPEWNSLVSNVLKNGVNVYLNKKQFDIYNTIIPLRADKKHDIGDIYVEIQDKLYEKYIHQKTGKFTSLVIP